MERRPLLAASCTASFTGGIALMGLSFATDMAGYFLASRAVGIGLVAMAVLLMIGLLMTAKKPIPPANSGQKVVPFRAPPQEPIPFDPGQYDGPAQIDSNEAWACGTALYLGEGVELNSKNFTSINTPRFLKAERGSKVNLEDTYHQAPDPNPKKTDDKQED